MTATQGGRGNNNDSDKTVCWKSVSWRQLAEHNREDDAWLAVRGHVYDVTSWVHVHPGGKDVILLNAVPHTRALPPLSWHSMGGEEGEDSIVFASIFASLRSRRRLNTPILTPSQSSVVRRNTYTEDGHAGLDRRAGMQRSCSRPTTRCGSRGRSNATEWGRWWIPSTPPSHRCPSSTSR